MNKCQTKNIYNKGTRFNFSVFSLFFICLLSPSNLKALPGEKQLAHINIDDFKEYEKVSPQQQAICLVNPDAIGIDSLSSIQKISQFVGCNSIKDPKKYCECVDSLLPFKVDEEKAYQDLASDLAFSQIRTQIREQFPFPDLGKKVNRKDLKRVNTSRTVANLKSLKDTVLTGDKKSGKSSALFDLFFCKERKKQITAISLAEALTSGNRSKVRAAFEEILKNPSEAGLKAMIQAMSGKILNQDRRAFDTTLNKLIEKLKQKGGFIGDNTLNLIKTLTDSGLEKFQKLGKRLQSKIEGIPQEKEWRLRQAETLLSKDLDSKKKGLKMLQSLEKSLKDDPKREKAQELGTKISSLLASYGSPQDNTKVSEKDLRKALTSMVNSKKIRAISALGKMATPNATSILMKVALSKKLKVPNKELISTNALAETGNRLSKGPRTRSKEKQLSEISKTLANLTHSKNGAVGKNAKKSLDNLRKIEIHDDLKLLGSQKERDRLKAYKALGFSKNPQALDSLLERFQKVDDPNISIAEKKAMANNLNKLIGDLKKLNDLSSTEIRQLNEARLALAGLSNNPDPALSRLGKEAREAMTKSQNIDKFVKGLESPSDEEVKRNISRIIYSNNENAASMLVTGAVMDLENTEKQKAIINGLTELIQFSQKAGPLSGNSKIQVETAKEYLENMLNNPNQTLAELAKIELSKLEPGSKPMGRKLPTPMGRELPPPENLPASSTLSFKSDQIAGELAKTSDFKSYQNLMRQMVSSKDPNTFNNIVEAFGKAEKPAMKMIAIQGFGKYVEGIKDKNSREYLDATLMMQDMINNSENKFVLNMAKKEFEKLTGKKFVKTPPPLRVSLPAPLAQPSRFSGEVKAPGLMAEARALSSLNYNPQKQLEALVNLENSGRQFILQGNSKETIVPVYQSLANLRDNTNNEELKRAANQALQTLEAADEQRKRWSSPTGKTSMMSRVKIDLDAPEEPVLVRDQPKKVITPQRELSQNEIRADAADRRAIQKSESTQPEQRFTLGRQMRDKDLRRIREGVSAKEIRKDMLAMYKAFKDLPENERKKGFALIKEVNLALRARESQAATSGRTARLSSEARKSAISNLVQGNNPAKEIKPPPLTKEDLSKALEAEKTPNNETAPLVRNTPSISEPTPTEASKGNENPSASSNIASVSQASEIGPDRKSTPSSDGPPSENIVSSTSANNSKRVSSGATRSSGFSRPSRSTPSFSSPGVSSSATSRSTGRSNSIAPLSNNLSRGSLGSGRSLNQGAINKRSASANSNNTRPTSEPQINPAAPSSSTPTAAPSARPSTPQVSSPSPAPAGISAPVAPPAPPTAPRVSSVSPSSFNTPNNVSSTSFPESASSENSARVGRDREGPSRTRGPSSVERSEATTSGSGPQDLSLSVGGSSEGTAGGDSGTGSSFSLSLVSSSEGGGGEGSVPTNVSPGDIVSVTQNIANLPPQQRDDTIKEIFESYPEKKEIFIKAPNGKVYSVKRPDQEPIKKTTKNVVPKKEEKTNFLQSLYGRLKTFFQKAKTEGE